MKPFKYIFFIMIINLLYQEKIESVDSVITFFIKEKPIHKNAHKNDNSSISNALVQPSFIRAIGKDRSWLDQPGVNGLHASYLGYLALSDKNGQITFPRQQQNDTIYLLITPEVEPEFMINPYLIHHWIIKKNHPAAFYEISRKKHKDLKTYYFNVKKIDVPQDIPLDTIIIYAHPDHVYVPVGISLNTYSTNFILPELQAKKINLTNNSLYTLSIKQYFEQINIDSKNNTLNIAAMVMNQ